MPKSYISKKLRRAVAKRAKGYCEYCLMPSDYSPSSFEIDHIQPESKDGKTSKENLALACRECNGHKFNKTEHINPVSKEPCRLYHPRLDDWYQHFEWDDDEIIIIGKTAVGKTTLDLLKLNRESNINQRSLLRLVGLHPPSDYP